MGVKRTRAGVAPTSILGGNQSIMAPDAYDCFPTKAEIGSLDGVAPLLTHNRLSASMDSPTRTT